MSGTGFIDVWVNCPDRGTAERIAADLVEARLVACANILPAVDSVYRWHGRIERATEVPLLLKTREALFETAAARIRALHPYEVPSIVATPLADADAAYAEWLAGETRPVG